MASHEYLSSFRLGHQALRRILVRDAEARDGSIPKTVFNWTHEGLVRTAPLPPQDTFEALAEWAGRCRELGIAAILILTKGDDLLDADDLLALGDLGIQEVNVRDGDGTDRAADGEWTIERWVALPDPAVLDVYYSSLSRHPLSAWRLVGDSAFWVSYGIALTSWVESGNFHVSECPQMYFEVMPEANRVVFGADEFRENTDAEAISALARGTELRDIRRVTRALRQPFVFDVVDGQCERRFGRIPGIDLAFKPGSVTPAAETLGRLAGNAGDWFCRLLEGFFKPAGGQSASPEGKTESYWLVVIESDHDDFRSGDGRDENRPVGWIEIGGDSWELVFANIPLRDYARDCHVTWPGLVDSETRQPASWSRSLSGGKGFPLQDIEVTVEKGRYSVADDPGQTTLIILTVDGRNVVWQVQPK